MIVYFTVIVSYSILFDLFNIFKFKLTFNHTLNINLLFHKDAQYQIY